MGSQNDNFLRRAGENWTVYYWVEGAEDSYKDKALTLDGGTTVRGIRSETAKETVRRDVRGQERTIDCQILVKADAISVTEIEDTRKEPPVFVSPTGVKYDSVAVGRESIPVTGMMRIFLLKQRGN